MRMFKKLISILLIITTVLCIFSGCYSEANEAYITNGQFYSLFIANTNIYTDKYSTDNIDDYKAAEYLLYDRYLLDDDQLNKYNKIATKEYVAQVCVRYMEFRRESDIKIKDISKCHDKQAVMDSVGMEILSIDNGYFDARQKMRLVDCQNAIDKMLNIELHSHYKEGELDIEYKDDAISLDDVEIMNLTVISEESSINPTQMSSKCDDIKPVPLDYKATDISENALDLSNKSKKIEKFMILKSEYNSMNPKPAVNKVVFKTGFSANRPKKSHNFEIQEPMAIKITEIDTSDPLVVTITGYQASAEEFLKDSDNEKKINERNLYNGGEIVDVTNNTVPEGIKINAKDGYLTVTFGHKFTMSDNIYGKQKWRNSKFSPSINITAKIGDFKLDVKNIGKLILGKKSDAEVKLTYKTYFNTTLESGGLRYSPANNGNGGLKYEPGKGFSGNFFANVNNARLTGASAGGSKSIKLAQIKFPIGKGFTIGMNLYLVIEFDGSISFEIKGAENAAELRVVKSRSGYTPSFKFLSEKEKSCKVNANATIEFQITPNISFLGLNIIDSVGKLGAKIDAMASVYSNVEKQFSEKFYATQTELDEQCNAEFGYCISASFKIYLGYEFLTTKSVIGEFVINKLGLKTPRDEFEKLSISCHFEDGHFVDNCTRGTDKLKKSNDGKINLSTYKLILDENGEISVNVESVPVVGKKLKKYGGIFVESANKEIASAAYDKTLNTVSVAAVGEGSTEITIKIKGKNGKILYSQQVSVTVNETSKISNTSSAARAVHTFPL